MLQQTAYLEIPNSPLDFTGKSAVVDASGFARLDFGGPQNGYVWKLERIACISAASDDVGIWTVYVVPTVGPGDPAPEYHRSAAGPSPRGSFDFANELRVRDTETLIVTGSDMIGGRITAAVQGLLCKVVPVSYDPNRVGLVGITT